jgi:hypothetical protein
MMTPDGTEAMFGALTKRGYKPEVAELYLASLGDVIEEDAQGRWIIRDDQGRVIDAIQPLEED